METIFRFFSRHAWILFIAVTIFNELRFRQKASEFINAHPELKRGYNKFWRKYLVIINIPWLIIAIGDITGMTESVNDFLFPLSMKPIVLMFHLSVLGLLITAFYWIYLYDGAEFLATFPNRFNNGQPNGKTNYIKILFAFILILGIAVEIFMWLYKGSPPKFPR